MQNSFSSPKIILIGVNHETAGVHVREGLALNDSDVPPLAVFAKVPTCDEVVFLSTCNRVEIISATRRPEETLNALKSEWIKRATVDKNDVNPSIYIHEDEKAIRHLFRVASSLDSMVLGEPQILGQLKEAYKNATEARTTGPILNKLLTRAFSVAKHIRAETGIASHAVSISFAAVELSKKIFGDLKGKKCMLIGAGEMSELAARHLISAGAGSLVVANRTLSRAVDLAKALGGSAISLEEIEDALIDVDIVISSTGSPELIIRKEEIQKIMKPRRHRLLFFIDIAVPRNIDPGANDIENVYLYDIDDLKVVVEANIEERKKEAVKAERIIEEEVIKLSRWLEGLNIVPVIKGLQKKAEEIRLKELEKSGSVLSNLTDEQRKAIDLLTRSIARKIIHDPIICLKKESRGENSDSTLDTALRLFSLNGMQKK